MDNINVVRVGFLSPRMKLVDNDMEIGDPIDRSGSNYTCMLFINSDESGAQLLKDIEQNIPASGNYGWILSAIVPCKTHPGKIFRDKYNLATRVYCDSDLRFGKLFGIIDSASAQPAYHTAIFVIGDEGSVRYRQVIDGVDFDSMAFRAVLDSLI
jgi:hypothetical protein